MSLQVLPTDPQYMYPPGTPDAGTWIAVTCAPIGPFGYQAQFVTLTSPGYEDEEWKGLGQPFGDLVTSPVPTDPAIRLAYYRANLADLTATVAAQFPNSPAPPTSWVSAYNPPVSIDLYALLQGFAGVFVAAPSLTQKFYKALVIVRDQILNSMSDYQIDLSIANVWPSSGATNRAALLSWLHAEDVINLANLSPG